MCTSQHASKHGTIRSGVETSGSSVSGWPVEALDQGEEAMERVAEAFRWKEGSAGITQALASGKRGAVRAADWQSVEVYALNGFRCLRSRPQNCVLPSQFRLEWTRPQT